MNIFLLLLIGISLSMDTFSLSLSLGTFKISRHKCILFSVIVGIFHFFMPLLGNVLGNSIDRFIVINPNRLLFIIFLFIAIEMLLQLLSKEEKKYDFSFLNMIIYAFSVSIDSLSVGVGLKAIVSFPIIGSIIFSIVSFLFTLIGLFIGKYYSEKLGKFAQITGFLIILILSIIHLLK